MIVCFNTGSVAIAQASQNGKEVPSPIVGMVTRNFVDETRKNWQGAGPRPVKTVVWYPAAATHGKKMTSVGDARAETFVSVPVLPDAELSQRSNKYPLILLSHGMGGSAGVLAWLGHYLASRGYIVAGVNHHGNTSAEDQYTAQGFLLYWERPRDLTFVLDRLLVDSFFGRHIDKNRIGAAGFSLGGYTVISTAGGVFSQEEYAAFCGSPRRDFTCEPQIEFPEAKARFEMVKKSNSAVQDSLRHAGDSYRDERIKGVFAIAPALGSGFTAAGLSGINIPVHILIGQGDTVAPLTTNAKRYADLIKGAKLTILPGAIGHYTFLAECTTRGKAVLSICRDAEGIDRVAVHEEANKFAFQFFDHLWAGK